MDEGKAVIGPAGTVRPGLVRRAGAHRWLFVGLALLTAVWVALFVARVQANQANIDDFLYAALARSMTYGDPVTAWFNSGQTAPLVPAVAALGARLAGINGAVAFQLLWLLLLAGGAYVMARTWVPDAAAAAAAVLAAGTSEALAYSVMLHFTIAASASVVWTFVCYQRSQRLVDRKWAIGVGLAASALLLSRAVNVVYAGPLALVLLLDLVVAHLRGRPVGWKHVAMAAATVVVLAGSWWAASGGAAWGYLTGAGFQTSTGYGGGGSVGFEGLRDRLNAEMVQLGWGQSIVLGGASVVAAVVAADRRRTWDHRLALPAAWWLLTWLALGLSSNPSTAMGLPLIAVQVVVVVVVLACSVRSVRWVTGLVACVAAVAGAAGLWSARPSNWWPVPPYRSQVIAGGGTAETDTNLLVQQATEAAGTHRTVVVKADPVLNANGVQWNRVPGQQVVSLPIGTSGTTEALQKLRDASALITGNAAFTFDPDLDTPRIEKAAFGEGFRPVRLWQVSPTNSIVLWRRAEPGRFPAPMVRMLKPAPGAVITGPVYFVASVSSPIGVASVSFRIPGPGGVTTSPAVQIAYGWLGGWTPGADRPGQYTVTAVARDMAGDSGTSSVTVLRVRP